MKVVFIGGLALVALAAAGAIGYEVGDHTSSTGSPTPHATSHTEGLTGVYVDGKAGFPHYYVSVTEGSSGSVKGAIGFAYEDGQTSVVLSFIGTAQNGVATLTPSVVTHSIGSTVATTVPSLLSMTYGGGDIGLGECTSYLTFVTSESDCFFNRAANKG